MSTPLSHTCENLFTILARVWWYSQMNSFNMVNSDRFPFDWFVTNSTNPTICRGIMGNHIIQPPFTFVMIHVLKQVLKICKNLWFSIYSSVSKTSTMGDVFKMSAWTYSLLDFNNSIILRSNLAFLKSKYSKTYPKKTKYLMYCYILSWIIYFAFHNIIKWNWPSVQKVGILSFHTQLLAIQLLSYMRAQVLRNCNI